MKVKILIVLDDENWCC